MTIYELQKNDLTPAIAYIVGLAYPLRKEIYYAGKECIVGGINYNYNYVTDAQLSIHRNRISDLMAKYKVDIEIVPNRGIVPKAGFALLIDKAGASTTECRTIFQNIVSEISASSSEVKKGFARGVFDGRSSYDTTLDWLSVDVDRDYGKQDDITDILESLGMDINVNRRDYNHPKNDQIRIKDNTTYIMRNIGLYSPIRQSYL